MTLVVVMFTVAGLLITGAGKEDFSNKSAKVFPDQSKTKSLQVRLLIIMTLINNQLS